MRDYDGWLLVDGHCDSIADMLDGRRDLRLRSTQGQLDVPRMRDAGVDAQVMALWTDSRFVPLGAMRRGLALVDAVHRLADESHEVSLALSVNDVTEAARSGRTALVLSLEGAEPLEGSIEALRAFFRLGVRMITLTWSRRNEVADGILESGTGGGLTSFGRQVVDEMARLGIVVDLSHISPRGFWDVLGRAQQPVVASHSNSQTICPHPRNLADDQVKAIAATGGLVGICFYPDFVDADKSRQDLSRVADHVQYLVDLVGPEHVGLGSDFDGAEAMVRGLEGVTQLPRLIEELARRGLSSDALRSFAGMNWMRAFSGVWRHIHHGG